MDLQCQKIGQHYWWKTDLEVGLGLEATIEKDENKVSENKNCNLGEVEETYAQGICAI